jgi:hypothetical protein
MTQSSTKAELVGFDDLLSKNLCQNFSLKPKLLKSKPTLSIETIPSSMQLEENGKASSGKHSLHFHIKFFYITNLINSISGADWAVKTVGTPVRLISLNKIL